MPFGSLPSGTFSSSRPGTLKVTLEAKFFASTYVDAGFPSSAGTMNLAIRAYAGPSGGLVYSAVMDRYSGSLVMELEYPGGGASWPVGVEEVAHKSPGGLYSYGFVDIKLACTLMKK